MKYSYAFMVEMDHPHKISWIICTRPIKTATARESWSRSTIWALPVC